ncbi:MAG: hypothetical protein AB1761_11600 [Pseudomonadota bacterium]
MASAVRRVRHPGIERDPVDRHPNPILTATFDPRQKVGITDCAHIKVRT